MASESSLEDQLKKAEKQLLDASLISDFVKKTMGPGDAVSVAAEAQLDRVFTGHYHLYVRLHPEALDGAEAPLCNAGVGQGTCSSAACATSSVSILTT